jgi:Uma2 family endonuclease
MAVDTQLTQHTNHSSVIPTDPIWRLSIDQYHQMIGGGILTDDDPVELLEGWLVTKMPKNPAHRVTTQLIREAIARLLPSNWFVDDQEPITTEESEPEPDVVIVRGQRRQYLDRHPHPQDIAVVVEVSDTTLQRDRTTKQRIYARAGIPTYWIVNLPDKRIEVYMVPSGPAKQPGYQHRQDFEPSETLPLVIDGTEVGRLLVHDLLP